MRYQYQVLLNDMPQIARAWLLSYEMGMYLIKITIDGQEGMVYSGDRPMRFSSIEQAREAFACFDIGLAELIHQSPYDEMIGLGTNGYPMRQVEAMRIPLKWQRDSRL